MALSDTPTANEDGFKIVTRKKSRKPMVGESAACQLGVVKKPRRRAVFTSRFDPSVTAQQIVTSLKNQLNIDDIIATKLRTKHNSYASFHVSVKEENFNLINNTVVWPTGCLISPFYGKLHTDQHFDARPNTQVPPVALSRSTPITSSPTPRTTTSPRTPEEGTENNNFFLVKKK